MQSPTRGREGPWEATPVWNTGALHASTNGNLLPINNPAPHHVQAGSWLFHQGLCSRGHLSEVVLFLPWWHSEVSETRSHGSLSGKWGEVNSLPDIFNNHRVSYKVHDCLHLHNGHFVDLSWVGCGAWRLKPKIHQEIKRCKGAEAASTDSVTNSYYYYCWNRWETSCWSLSATVAYQCKRCLLNVDKGNGFCHGGYSLS